jgi:hypothetical protein
VAGFKKALIVVHRNESADDFQQIARRIRKLDSTICVTMVSDFLTSKMVPDQCLNLPMLVVYLCNPPKTEFKVATKLAVKEMSKIEEYEHFKQHNIPCLPIERFIWGMELDPEVYGDWVILKPEHIQSTGKDVNMVPIKEIPNLKLSDFPENHLIHKDSFYIQKFIKTGKSPTYYRVLFFLGEILLSYKVEQNAKYPSANEGLNSLLKKSVATNLQGNREINLVIDSKVNDFAKNVAIHFPNLPILGIDIIPEEQTGDLIVLEINAGGNTWAFSAAPSQNLRSLVGLKNMVLQYNSWDRSAEALVRKTHELAK